MEMLRMLPFSAAAVVGALARKDPALCKSVQSDEDKSVLVVHVSDAAFDVAVVTCATSPDQAPSSQELCGFSHFRCVCGVGRRTELRGSRSLSRSHHVWLFMFCCGVRTGFECRPETLADRSFGVLLVPCILQVICRQTPSCSRELLFVSISAWQYSVQHTKTMSSILVLIS